ncbi:HvfC/BufC N-terminal domain-containing protein [Paucibacter sp. XJ19-41]|uniref:HvfC/BufC N-terminal domain-containing protein n=1 Tax=Paucibacter sp. XJ19-41 TaxID=2927824 RepID=UPI00234BB187|nr:DNA-binding domain-containing protein [Paucibacter sp. XJ19-41]MDC6169359.1 DNA-binding domain-containing protein [Paucibacter sp. XJ19-41]
MMLETLQAEFQALLLDQPQQFAAAVRPGGIGIERRLAIYHQAYRARLVETLLDSYGHTAAYLGDEAFEREARAYLIAHPSGHPSLRWFGAAFPAWLAERHPQDLDIAELAALDWALREAFDAADAQALTPADLAALPAEAWATVGFGLPPSYRRLRLSHNTLAIWQALDQDEAPPAAEPLAQALDVLIWRRGSSPHFRSLGSLEAAALDALAQGRSFAMLCEDLSERFPETDIASEAGGLLRRWVEEGLLAGVIRAQ